MQQGRSLYEAGQFAAAVEVLRQAVRQYQAQVDSLGEAIALSNLSLVYQQLGQWSEATTAITTALDRLQGINDPGKQAILAQALDVQGRLQLSQGQAEAALATWEQATQIYQDLEDQVGIVRTQINQAEALQALGLYRRAILLLDGITESLQEQPDSLVQVVALRSLGDALRVTGELTHSIEVLQQSLAVAQRLQNGEAIAATQLSLGNTFYAQSHTEEALAAYQQAILAGSLVTQTHALLNQFSLLINHQQWIEAQALIPQITARINQLPASRTTVYTQVNFAKNLLTLAQAEPDLANQSAIESAQLLTIAIQSAQTLQDLRAESFALGNLGKVYEQAQQWQEAQALTEQALNLSQQIYAADITYLWQWQLGRIFKAQNQRDKAIAAYSDAVTTLRSLRSDLVAVNQEVQFSFRDSIEPIHRQLVSLLLEPGVEPTQADLEQARKTIESLQLAELDNFFREACLNAREVQIDEVDRRAAVIYPIILGDRLEVIISLPQPIDSPTAETSTFSAAKQVESTPDPELLKHHTTFKPKDEVEKMVGDLRAFLERAPSNYRARTIATQIYDWLIRPIETDLETSQVKTLVFVLDGVLRNIPMSVLYDGERYLIEKYSLALTPSLQLLEPRSLQPQQLNVLMAGLTEARQGFRSLPNVRLEFETIQSEVSSQILLNEQFTNTTFQEAINAIPFPVVHLATHGQFSSQAENTFILTWDDRIKVNDLSSLLQASDIGRRRPIELLVLSACQTAEGDARAALGLAGVAVRAGARSTVATLWSVSDDATALLMGKFYEELAHEQVTKAEALRQAQLSLLENPQYSQPYYWSPVVLVGNWL
jgi:CHAT domain-containing protein